MACTSHRCPPFDDRLSWVMTAYALTLIVVLAPPAASLTWLGGAHATIEQVTLHKEAVVHAHFDHHGGLEHHEHRPGDGARRMDTQLSPTGPVFASAAISMGPLHDLLQAMLTVLPDASPPGVPPGHASPVEIVLCRHSPPVPHKPPIFT